MDMYNVQLTYTNTLTNIVRGSVKNTCKMLMALGIGSRDVYEDDFERPLLEESREFYRVSAVLLDNS